ncbi:enoyl-CoA hydratase/isomerase family protein [Rhodovarius lipocyclicus]|uniref:enoyl-CoA hydratase/isomerase family protein n=1 Tax=Rhodovarius lipocyclicus TaxID=268410 RepID=UPI0013597413|nr:enoyl-CoA hydratase-related protein [Rhodovarius lipocyclicus]
MEQPILITRAGPVMHITLNRPHRRNALSLALVAELDKALAELEASPAFRVVVLRGAAGHFCAGLDLVEVAEDQLSAEQRLEAQLQRNAAMGARLLRIASLPQVVVARVRGSAFAGGLGLNCAADIAIADASARFCAPETLRGLVAAQILPWITRRTGPSQARRLVLQAQVLDAAAAAKIGLVHEVFADEAALDAGLEAIVKDLLKGSPQAMAETKTLLAALGAVSPAGYAEAGAQAFARCAVGDAVEGIAAFRERRKPAWETL